MPHLRKQGTATQLIVDGKPFLALAGELSNSSATGVEYMKLVWPRLAQHTGLNTVLAGVSWNQIEPREGKFDFTVLDSVIQGARAHNLRLMLLWFGSWKNGLSSYMPEWVKRDDERFPRAQIVGDDTPWPVWGVTRTKFTGGMNIELLSPFGEATRDADARAFAALMRHLKAVDSQQRTVLMVQVENEVGLQGDTRDRSPAANKAFDGPVPQELIDYIQQRKDTLIPAFRKVWEAAGFKTSGTWEEVFGKGRPTEEIFIAWHFARYVDRVAAAGKAEYPLPLFVNCPQDGFGRMPAPLKGSGQSGGPMPDAMDVWRAGAPRIDLYGADIYSPDYIGYVSKYTQSGNTLFIPETRGDMEARVLYAFGRHDAIGISLMGIERLTAPETEMIRGFDAVRQLTPLIAKHQGMGTMSGVLVGPMDQPKKLQLGNYTFEVAYMKPRGLPGAPDVPQNASSGIAVFIDVGPDEYYVVGNSASVRFAPNTPGPEHAGLGTVEEGTFVNGRWAASRQIAGDEVDQGQSLSLRSLPPDRIPDHYVGIQHFTLYRYR
jgi:beta-galactosidase GanA